MGASQAFNRSPFGQWVNGRSGRIFKLCAGVALVGVGLATWGSPWGVAALAWSALPLSAATFDVCWISVALGGPLRNSECVAAGRSADGSA